MTNTTIDTVIETAEAAMKFFNDRTQIKVIYKQDKHGTGRYQMNYGGTMLHDITPLGLIKLAEYERLYWMPHPKPLNTRPT